MTGGDKLNGQLGLGDDKRRSTPFRIDIKNVNKIACGLNHTVLLKNHGPVWSVGNNRSGQLGHSNDDERLNLSPFNTLRTPREIPNFNIKQVYVKSSNKQ